MSRVKNPSWNRDELILALDLYLRVNPSKISSNHPEVIKLSELLNKLFSNPDLADVEKFRNPNGVYMKLCNFLRLDPSYHGAGLTRGSKLEKDIWDEFAHRPDYLHAIASEIGRNTNTGQLQLKIDDDDNESFPEGKILYRQHRLRERNKQVTRKVKANGEKNQQLHCQVCGFDFFRQYGELGKGYIECHHLVPVSEYNGETRVSVGDFALVCSNCHRMLHRRRPWLTLEELTALLPRT